jgi:hypothetical protein
MPALIKVFEQKLFPRAVPSDFACRCATCTAAALAAVAVVLLNIPDYQKYGWTKLTVFSLALTAGLIALCQVLSRRKKCRIDENRNNG